MTTSEAKHIGIAAVSAEGAALCYRTICAEGAAILGAHAHPQITMHTHPLADYMRHLDAGRDADAAELLRGSAKVLVDAGAELLICPDNTLHDALDSIRDESEVPWLHIAEEVARVAAERGHRKLGILGTRYLMEGPVYPRKLAREGIDHVVPDERQRERIHEIIFEDLVYGCFQAGARSEFVAFIESLEREGCDAVVLGCTEIPLLISQRDSPLPILDSTRILARAALRAATVHLGALR